MNELLDKPLSLGYCRASTKGNYVFKIKRSVAN